MNNFEQIAEMQKYFATIMENSSVAVVGSSPTLLKSLHGHLIDSNDVVIRFNDADVRGLEKHVGSKTSIRFVGFSTSQQHEKFFQEVSEDSVILTKEKNRVFFDSLSCNLEPIYYTFNINKLTFKKIDSVFSTSFSKKTDKVPRTGLSLLCALLFSEINYSQLSVYGMEKYPRKTGQVHFYNDKRSFERILKNNYDKFHCDLDFELEVFRFLLAKCSIQFS